MQRKKSTHGGARKGAGRPKTKEDTIVMRVPKSLVPAVKKLISLHSSKSQKNERL